MMKTLLIAAALAVAPPALAQDVVAQRGAIKLSTADVRDLVSHTDPSIRAQLQSSPAALTDFVRSRLLRQSLLAEAKAKGWDQTPDVTAKLAEARDDLIVSTYVANLAAPDPSYPSDTEIAAAYEANKSAMVRPRQYQLSQIVLLSPPGNPQDDDLRKRLLALRQQAARPRADFADLARKNSQDRPSAERGGELGWVREDQLIPAIKDAVSGLQEGAVSDPVRIADVWHILKLLGTRPAGPVPLPEVREQLIQALRQQRAQQLAKTAVDESLRRDPIQINEIGLQAALTK